MSRGNANTEPQFQEGAVRVIEDLGTTVDDIRQLGFRVVLHWSNVPAVTEKDAFSIVKRRQLASEQHEAWQDERVVAQQQWPRRRSEAWRSAYAEAMRGKRGTSDDRERAEKAAMRADREFLRANDPVAIGMPESLREPAQPRFLDVPASEGV